ncbi:hypothetical protein [Streptomyces sp. NPDC088196]|uniref:hypothetical protein n=1 Tax=Streptomyces sp. NPDC088196 TaxID=3154868 RepID=UPI00344F4B28
MSVPTLVPRCGDATSATVEPSVEAVERTLPKVQELQIEIHVHTHCTLGHQMATTQNPTDLH